MPERNTQHFRDERRRAVEVFSALLAVLVLVVLPVAGTQILRLVIHVADTRRVIVRPGFFLPAVSNPLISVWPLS